MKKQNGVKVDLDLPESKQKIYKFKNMNNSYFYK